MAQYLSRYVSLLLLFPQCGDKLNCIDDMPKLSVIVFRLKILYLLIMTIEQKKYY